MRFRAGRGFALLMLAALLAMPLAAPQQDAYYEVAGVEYYYAIGHQSAMQAVWDGDGEEVADFWGCSWAKTRPDKGAGRISTMATLQGLEMEAEFTNLFGTEGGVERDRKIAWTTLAGESLEVPVTMLAQGEVSLRVDGLTFKDPATGNESFQGTWFVTEAGFMEATGAALDAAAVPAGAARSDDGDWEMHMRIRSLPDLAQQEPVTTTFARPDDMTPVMPPDENYREVFPFRNERFRGTGHLEFSASSVNLPGLTDATVQLIAPNGTTLLEEQVAPSLAVDAGFEAEFPLDLLGDYFVAVDGELNASQYQVTITQDPPEQFRLDVAYEEVVAGYQALQEKAACETAIHGESATGFIPERPGPPHYSWLATLLTVGAASVAVLVTAALVASTQSTAKAKSLWKRRAK